jgi:hypothetical protein
MPLDYTYEEITSDEADFIISLYEIISRLVREERAVTLVGLAYELNIKTSELSDYLMLITSILDKVEEEYQIQQGFR